MLLIGLSVCIQVYIVMHLLICFASPLMLQTRVAAVFVFISFASLLSIAGVPALLKEIKVTFLARYLFFPFHC